MAESLRTLKNTFITSISKKTDCLLNEMTAPGALQSAGRRHFIEQKGIGLRSFGVNDEIRTAGEWPFVRSRVDTEEMVPF